MDSTLGPILNITDERFEKTSPDLTAFKVRGGKLILYHGLADPVVSPKDSLEYYVGAQPNPKEDFIALYLDPGMGHCLGGDGPYSFGASFHRPPTGASNDILEVLAAWDTKPQMLSADKYQCELIDTKCKDLTKVEAASLLCRVETVDPNDVGKFTCYKDTLPSATKTDRKR